jgi:2-polyprenyl-3-methyl-5-hydroxy-6-metoxy-1,4-benzoquinol methylase
MANDRGAASPPDAQRVAQFVAHCERLSLHPKPRLLAHTLPTLFDGVRLEGKDVLDVGGGTGIYSLFTSFCGARSVVCLEPEAAGSLGAGVSARFNQLSETLGLKGTELQNATLQAFEPNGRQFDVILLNNSVNHLDEPACIELHKSAAARETFSAIFARLAALARPGAALILTDVSSKNFWPMVGLRNPLVNRLAWHKHQPPGIWSSLLQKHGFVQESLTWTSPSVLGAPGKLFAANAAAAFFFSSHFRLRMRKAG